MLKAIYHCRAIDNDGSTQGLFGALDAAAFADEDAEGAAAGGRSGAARGAGAGGDGARWLRPLGPYFQARLSRLCSPLGGLMSPALLVPAPGSGLFCPAKFRR